MTRLLDTVTNRQAIRTRLQLERQSLALVAAELDTIDHDAARHIHAARDALHEAWRILREAPRND